MGLVERVSVYPELNAYRAGAKERLKDHGQRGLPSVHSCVQEADSWCNLPVDHQSYDIIDRTKNSHQQRIVLTSNQHRSPLSYSALRSVVMTLPPFGSTLYSGHSTIGVGAGISAMFVAGLDLEKWIPRLVSIFVQRLESQLSGIARLYHISDCLPLIHVFGPGAFTTFSPGCSDTQHAMLSQ